MRNAALCDFNSILLDYQMLSGYFCCQREVHEVLTGQKWGEESICAIGEMVCVVRNEPSCTIIMDVAYQSVSSGIDLI